MNQASARPGEGEQGQAHQSVGPVAQALDRQVGGVAAGFGGDAVAGCRRVGGDQEPPADEQDQQVEGDGEAVGDRGEHDILLI